MKRQTITGIIGKVQLLMMDAVISDRQDRSKYYTMIRKAADNEIKRIHAKSNKVAFADGYDAGFQTATIAAQSIITAQDNFDSLGEPDVFKEIGLEPFDVICKTLSNIPGSGYEFLKEKP